MRTSQCHHIYPPFYYGFSRRVALVEATKKISWVIGSARSLRASRDAHLSRHVTYLCPIPAGLGHRKRPAYRPQPHPLGTVYEVSGASSLRAGRLRHVRHQLQGCRAVRVYTTSVALLLEPGQNETPPSDGEPRWLVVDNAACCEAAGSVTQDPYTSPKPRHAKTFLVQTLANVTPWRYNYAHIQNERAANHADAPTTTR